jgi:hypothetical protein
LSEYLSTQKLPLDAAAGHLADIAGMPAGSVSVQVQKWALGLLRKFTGINVKGAKSIYIKNLEAFERDAMSFEIFMQDAARRAYGDVVPKIIGRTKSGTGFIQEYAGVELPTAYDAAGLKLAQKHMDLAAQHGGVVPVHLDLKTSNMVRKGTRLSLIDWGVSAKTAVTPFEAEMSKTVIAEQFKRIRELRNKSRSLSDIFKDLGLKQDLQVAKKATDTRLETSVVSEESLQQYFARNKRKLTRASMDRMQTAVQAMPFKLNAQRRMSNGVDKTRK